MNAKQSEHFIGTLITKQRESERIGENSCDLIDGQQRLTTSSLLLKAIELTCKGDFPKLRDNIAALLLFEDSKGQRYGRIEPSQSDKKYFDSIIYNLPKENLANKEHKILRAYSYFEKKVLEFTDQERDDLKNIILNRVPVISMLLSPNDDEQVIFDTINSLGVKLTTAELLKNYIFKEKELRNLYSTHWQDVFEADDSQISFWNRDKTAGRIIRTNIEVLLYCYLIIKTQSEVRLERLFKEYKNWLTGQTTEQKQLFLQELNEYTDIYAGFPDGNELNEFTFIEDEKRFFHVIVNLGITTAYPLILYIYKEVTDPVVRKDMLKLLESYLIRRAVCRLTTKNYNNLFLSIIQKLIAQARGPDAKPIDVVILRSILTGFSDDTNRFPGDADFVDAFKQSHLSNQHAREILYGIALYQKNDNLSDIQKLSSSSFTIEHFMPVKWEANWMIREMNDAEKIKRNRKLRTMGNLTLVTKRLNSKMQNAAWPEKKKLLKQYSSLRITTDYVEAGIWDESSIDKRSEDLSKLALEMWPR